MKICSKCDKQKVEFSATRVGSNESYMIPQGKKTEHSCPQESITCPLCHGIWTKSNGQRERIHRVVNEGLLNVFAEHNLKDYVDVACWGLSLNCIKDFEGVSLDAVDHWHLDWLPFVVKEEIQKMILKYSE